MSMNTAPNAERVHIGIFGKRNAGKSSLINAMTGQDLAIVSNIAGTTTDPVSKAMELLPLGPVVMIDTPGLDDIGALGAQRVRKAMQVMNKCDLAIVVVDASEGLTDAHTDLLARLKAKNIPHLIAMNKCDLLDAVPADTEHMRYVSAAAGTGIYALKEAIAHLVPTGDNGRRIIADLLQPNDFVVLVVPIDSAAPKGRLILPQQQTIRGILEAGATAIVCQDTELKATLKKPGIRLGYCLSADRQLVDRLYEAGAPWSVSGIAQACGIAAAQDTDFPRKTRAYVALQRAALRRGLEDLGLHVIDGQVNYLLFRNLCIPDLQRRLHDRGILIRSCANYHGLDDTWFRIAVRNETENFVLLHTLRQLKEESAWQR